jgi:arginyl-tRNA synthetase
VSQSLDTHLEIEIQKVTAQSNDNPLYYVQYAHARICQISKKSTQTKPTNKFDLLTTEYEKNIINELNYFKPLIEIIANNYEVSKLVNYLINLAKLFHSFYSNNKIIDEKNEKLSTQRY